MLDDFDMNIFDNSDIDVDENVEEDLLEHVEKDMEEIERKEAVMRAKAKGKKMIEAESVVLEAVTKMRRFQLRLNDEESDVEDQDTLLEPPPSLPSPFKFIQTILHQGKGPL